MWRPWSKALEAFGRLRLRAPFRWRTTVAVGDPSAPDAEGGFGWREYVEAERLYDVWGPHPESVWTAYHTVPLFAAIDSLKRDAIGPAPPPEAIRAESISPPADTLAGTPAPPDGAPPPLAAPNGSLAHPVPGDPAPAWVRRDTWTIVDLPGPLAVRAAAWLVTGTGCQPVCTFDNWPHARGVLKAEQTLAELLRWATTVARVRSMLDASSPPLWVCDSDRLGAAAPRPREFDNRYYLDDSILPGAAVLREAGIHRVIYVTRPPGPPPGCAPPY
jgi:hypothetical protein